jgi:PAS domain S-box-containing protein
LLISNDALRQSKEKYRTVADFTYDWEFWLDQNDVIRYCSPSCERITGYHAGEFIQNPQLIHEIIHPDDREGNQCHEHNEEMAKDTNQEIQFRIIRSDGTIRWIGHVCQPVYNDSGEFTGIRGGNRDITGRKNMEQQLKTSEQKYKLLSENITDGIFIIRNGCFEYVNKAMARIFEYEDYEMIGLSLSQLVTSDHREDLIKFLTFDIHLKQGWSIEIECIKKSLKIVIVEIQINYVVNEGLVYGIVHDVTEKKQIQKNIVKAIIQTEEKERASFSKELHDGLGPLLSLIKHYMQWTQRPNSNKSSDDIIKKAEIVIDEALATVKEISNKLSPHILTSYGLTSAIQSFIDKLEETSEINIEFESNVAKRSDLEIEAALYRAVIECINNTIKHARARKIIIRLHDSDNQLYVQYTDDGIGFDVPNALSQQKGLGLFNLQNRIQTIGGKISMQSSPGNGVNYQIIVNLTN